MLVMTLSRDISIMSLDVAADAMKFGQDFIVDNYRMADLWALDQRIHELEIKRSQLLVISDEIVEPQIKVMVSDLLDSVAGNVKCLRAYLDQIYKAIVEASEAN